MISRPLSSTLFPYTTLFRSRGAAQRIGESPDDRGAVAHRVQRDPRDARPRRRPRRGAAAPRRTRLADRGGDGDRKSTRLNSSHANISYAVFCLKKKNKITRI